MIWGVLTMENYYVDETNQCATIRSSIIYRCGSCGANLFDDTCDRCPCCRVRLEK
jgi:hypothetical protein